MPGRPCLSLMAERTRLSPMPEKVANSSQVMRSGARLVVMRLPPPLSLKTSYSGQKNTRIAKKENIQVEPPQRGRRIRREFDGGRARDSCGSSSHRSERPSMLPCGPAHLTFASALVERDIELAAMVVS